MTSSMTKEISQHDRRDRGGAGIVEFLQPDDDQQRRDLGDVGQVAGDEDDRAVFADGAREGQREAGEDGRRQAAAGCTRVMVWKRLAPSVAAASSTSWLELFEHRLHGAHDEGQADEDQRDDDAERRVGDLDAERREQAGRSSHSAHRARSARCRRPRSAARRAGRRWHRAMRRPGKR